MFIEETDFIEINVYYLKQGHSFSAYNETDFEKLDKETKLKCKKLSLKMKPLTFGLNNDFQEMSVEEDINGNRRFNYKKYKEARLQNLIVEWDAKNKEEQIVPINVKNITQMAPAIAETILTSYNMKNFLSEEDEGN